MRFIFDFVIENGNRLPLEYRRLILSLLKKAIGSVDPDIPLQTFDKIGDLYNEKVVKPYSFSVFLSHPKFLKDEIELEGNEVKIIYSTSDFYIPLNLYSAFQKRDKFIHTYHSNGKEYIISFKKAHKVHNSPIFQEVATFKTLSPVVVREHDKETNQDKYYTDPEDENFIRLLTENTKEKAKRYLDKVPKFKIVAAKTKRVPVKHYNRYVEANLGVIKIEGDSELLQLVYDIGLGSSCSQGFGLLETIN